jgi:hypothetical protein
MGEEEIVQCSMFNIQCSSAVALRAILYQDAAPKAHPKMKYDN